MELWFASGNVHKKQELAALLPGHAIRSPPEAGIIFDPEETGSSFLENALIKARCLFRLIAGLGLGGPVIADDSGLCVDALGGRPGIYSARYGEAQGSRPDAAGRNRLLLKEMEGITRRNARFVCAMVLLINPDRFFIAQETLEGEIVGDPGDARGSGGFGYDPILYLPERGLTVAELTEADKNLISHRGKAGRTIAKILADG
jgi:XTP/dITP diphosphohydrolase